MIKFDAITFLALVFIVVTCTNHIKTEDDPKKDKTTPKAFLNTKRPHAYSDQRNLEYVGGHIRYDETALRNIRAATKYTQSDY